MSNTNFNPLLIHALTNTPLEDIPTSPSLKNLPGELALLVAKHIEDAPIIFPENKMTFVCKVCKKRGKYDMGNVSIDLNKYKHNQGMTIENHTQHTGYFRCKNCNSAGKWGIVLDYNLYVTTQLIQFTATQQENESFYIGENQLFDGSKHQYATDAEEHLLNKILDSTTNALLWNKLGNMYYAGSRADLAAAALEHSLLLDPLQTESYYSLGVILERIAPEKAISYYYKMLASALYYHQIDSLKLRQLIASTFHNLAHLQLILGKQLSLGPGVEVYKELGIELPKPLTGESARFTDEIEIGNIESFYPLAEAFMGDRKKELPKRKKKR